MSEFAIFDDPLERCLFKHRSKDTLPEAYNGVTHVQINDLSAVGYDSAFEGLFDLLKITDSHATRDPGSIFLRKGFDQDRLNDMRCIMIAQQYDKLLLATECMFQEPYSQSPSSQLLIKTVVSNGRNYLRRLCPDLPKVIELAYAAVKDGVTKSHERCRRGLMGESLNVPSARPPEAKL